MGQRERAARGDSLTLVLARRGRPSALEVVAAMQGGAPPLQLLAQINLALTAND